MSSISGTFSLRLGYLPRQFFLDMNCYPLFLNLRVIGSELVTSHNVQTTILRKRTKMEANPERIVSFDCPVMIRLWSRRHSWDAGTADDWSESERKRALSDSISKTRSKISSKRRFAHRGEWFYGKMVTEVNFVPRLYLTRYKRDNDWRMVQRQVS